MFDSLRPHGLSATRLLYPWDSPGKNTGVGSHSLLYGIFLTQGLNPGLLHCKGILYHLSHQGSKWQPTPVFLPGKYHGWRSLVGYRPWGHKESDMTERHHSLIVSCIMTPTPTKYNHVRIPESCECFLICKRKCFIIMIKLRLLRCRDYPAYLIESFFFFFLCES